MYFNVFNKFIAVGLCMLFSEMFAFEANIQLSIKYALTRSNEQLFNNANHLKQSDAILKFCLQRLPFIGAKLLVINILIVASI